jgi:hypothetical protein
MAAAVRWATRLSITMGEEMGEERSLRPADRMRLLRVSRSSPLRAIDSLVMLVWRGATIKAVAALARNRSTAAAALGVAAAGFALFLLWALKSFAAAF